MEGLNSAVKEKILSHNAKALYALQDRIARN
jgi:predicted TIM-barrel fold metal-dependent hydrolase